MCIISYYYRFIEQNTAKGNITTNCSPRQKIGFLKTHKCASSSIQNILLRFVMKHDLNVVHPKKNNYLGHFHPTRYFLNQEHFKKEFIADTVWEKAHLDYDILLCHTRWDHIAITEVLNDHGDVFYFSILRDPVEIFRSFWDYAKLSKIYKTTLQRYAKTVISKEVRLNSKSSRSPGYNQMLSDFGFDFKDMIRDKEDRDTKTVTDRVWKKVMEIDKNFDLIVFADQGYFEASLILLQNSLCWSTDDMISIKLNSYPSKYKSKISPLARKIIKGAYTEGLDIVVCCVMYKIFNNLFLNYNIMIHLIKYIYITPPTSDWLWADYILYDYFKEKFMKKIEIFGTQKLKLEKQMLRNKSEETMKRCKENNLDKDCNYLRKGEKAFLDEVREKQTIKSLQILEMGNS